MKPPIDWSPCQQKGEEHIWLPMMLTNSNTRFWWCGAYGVFILDVGGADA